MKEIQKVLLEFLDDETEAEGKYETFVKLLEKQKIEEDQEEFKSLLKLINSIGNEHHRNYLFNKKVDQILERLKSNIKKYFKNSEIFEIFEMNKRILLFLIESKTIIIDEHITSQLTRDKYENLQYGYYFLPEIKPFLTEEFIEKSKNTDSILNNEEFINEIKNELPENFIEKRRIGERETYLSEIIRKDQIIEFVVYVNKNCLSLQSFIKESIFETNWLLTYEETSLIEYAAFFGSINIIKYIHTNGVYLPQSIWEYAIHSENAELIRYLEDNHVSPTRFGYESVLETSIQCHHNNISNYIIDNLIKKEDLKHNIESKYYTNIYRYGFNYHNYFFLPEDIKNKYIFFYICEFDYFTLFKLYLQQGDIDVNAVSI